MILELIISVTCSCQEENTVLLDLSKSVYVCEHCGKKLFKLNVLTGYIYLLSNSSMPGLMKIGYTERDVEARISELNNTGLPLPFEIEAYWGSSNPFGDEQIIHKALANHRLASNREFFSIDVKSAIQSINEQIGTEPLFLKTPELLMSESERVEYEEKQMELPKGIVARWENPWFRRTGTSRRSRT